jgi:nicotinamide riboside kinase
MSLRIIELYGCPGSGKTYLAAQLQAAFTRSGINSLYVHEFIKDYAVRKLPITPDDQMWIAGNQFRIESSAYGVPPKYQVLITDSPVMLAGFYAFHYSQRNDKYLVLSSAIRTWLELADVKYDIQRVRYRVMLQRRYFKPEGRFENTFEDAQAAEHSLEIWMKDQIPGDIQLVPTVTEDYLRWEQEIVRTVKGA